MLWPGVRRTFSAGNAPPVHFTTIPDRIFYVKDPYIFVLPIFEVFWCPCAVPYLQ